MQEQRDSLSVNAIEPAKYETVDFNCPIHGAVKARVMEFAGVKMSPRCPQCQALEAQKEKELKIEEDKKRNEGIRQKIIQNMTEAAMIPLRFEKHSFKSYVEKTPEHTKKRSLCLDYARNFPERLKRGTSVILTGTTGTGKTHLACAIANYVIQEHCKSAVFLSVLNAVRRVKETYKKSSLETEREAIKSFLHPDLLILDEIGVQFGSDTEKMITFEIINQRYENLKPTILISNLSADNLRQFVGDRIMDRMKENNGLLISFDFQSHRNTKLTNLES